MVSSEVPVILPLHPRTRQRLESLDILETLRPPFHLVEPLGYLDMLAVERSAASVATDSGGVQKEAFFFGVPCVTLRNETEWTELVALGWNCICPPSDPTVVATAVRKAIGRRGNLAPRTGTVRPRSESSIRCERVRERRHFKSTRVQACRVKTAQRLCLSHTAELVDCRRLERREVRRHER